MKTLLASLLLAALFAASSASDVETTHPEPCAVRAWVRAEDLSPDHISRGELRIKVPRAECANQIASVALRLQLDEFGEFKYLKGGAIIPEVQPSNQSTPSGYADWMGSDVVYDYQAHDDSLSDPALWAVKAEERRAWTTEATLIENNPDLSQPIVTAFTVAVPCVNYPPVLQSNHRHILRAPVLKHSFSDLSYRYFAVVTFIDGRIEDVPAGRTTFIPSLQLNPQQTLRTWNVTFEDFDCRRDTSPAMKKRDEDLEKCLPEVDRSSFVAEITLEEGNILQRGQSLKGRVTVRRTKDGSTAMSDISVSLVTSFRDHWAQAQAAAGGDVEFYNSTSWPCSPLLYGSRELCAESERFAYVFDENDEERMIRSRHLSFMKPVSLADPYYDFEIEVPPETPVDFTSYYTTGESLLQLRLTVLYSIDIAKCVQPNDFKSNIPGDEEMTTDETAATEEGMWNMYTRVGKSAISDTEWSRSMTLQAMVPITVVRGGAVPTLPIMHYLTPGALAPVLRSGAQLKMPASFPPVQPIFTVEALANTSARLMQPGSTDPYQRRMNITRLQRDYPDPARNYQNGNYAGVLWKKKVVAEERGILPMRTEVVDGGDRQQSFHIAP
ncbi:hypothetical protein MVEN_00972700 [Mycena venus]|uniref:Arrestin-like N-terminal domain-containing protein n=1 Tax=Mycena venus TaxID=2733690 RepID=A0A8H6YCV1_9AGAR|nr:hypothetical protein MVEN_00972700 [Mycena venus]